jgi:hypothetical protein
VRDGQIGLLHKGFHAAHQRREIPVSALAVTFRRGPQTFVKQYVAGRDDRDPIGLVALLRLRGRCALRAVIAGRVRVRVRDTSACRQCRGAGQHAPEHRTSSYCHPHPLVADEDAAPGDLVGSEI